MPSKIKTSFLILGFAFVFFFSFSFFSLAQELEIEYPEAGGIKPEAIKTGLPEYVKYIFNYAIIISGLIAFGALVWAGMLYLSSTGDPSKIKEARERILSAVVGLVILLSSYLILVTVNPELVIFNLSLLPLITAPEVKPPPPMVITEGASLIVEEIPVGQMAEKGIWEEEEEARIEEEGEAKKEGGFTLAYLTSEEKTKEIKTVITNFENFLEQETKINDPALTNDVFTKISDINKYLKTVTDECH
ncbi:MAG: hypothetical protein FJZ07_02260, partial [Candidatus Nealsonbacteria bacterium]|nr:hypothetical protein [Candidatus Nealsonbacteria bacterium]